MKRFYIILILQFVLVASYSQFSDEEINKMAESLAKVEMENIYGEYITIKNIQIPGPSSKNVYNTTVGEIGGNIYVTNYSDKCYSFKFVSTDDCEYSKIKRLKQQLENKYNIYFTWTTSGDYYATLQINERYEYDDASPSMQGLLGGRGKLLSNDNIFFKLGCENGKLELYIYQDVLNYKHEQNQQRKETESYDF